MPAEGSRRPGEPFPSTSDAMVGPFLECELLSSDAAPRGDLCPLRRTLARRGGLCRKQG